MDELKLKIEYVPIENVRPYAANAKKHDQRQVDNVAESIRQFGFVQPVVIDKDGVIVIGHCRVLAAKKIGMASVPCVNVDDLTPEQVNALRVVDNKSNESEWDLDLLAAELPGLDLSMFDFDFGLDFGEELPQDSEEKAGNMAEKYLVPPFSVLYANRPDWLARKRAWVNKGIRSELGRGGTCLQFTKRERERETGRTGESLQEQQPIKRISKAKAYADGLIEKRDQIKRGTYRGNTV